MIIGVLHSGIFFISPKYLLNVFHTSCFYNYRAIYECDDHPKFTEQLDKRIKYHDKEIERMCNNYYQGFIDSIKDLQQVRNQAKNLKVR